MTGEECALLCHVLNGTITTAWEIGAEIRAGTRRLTMLQMEIEDAEAFFFDKWGIDRAATLAKLHDLTPIEEAALVDAVERFWRAVAMGEERNPREILSR